MVANAAATAYSNQRKIDRCQNGNLVMIYADTTAYAICRLSTDNGVTWTGINPDIVGFSNGSIFIDLDDYLHVVWKQSGTGGGRTDGYIYYMRGTPNAGRTSWTWSAASLIYGSVAANYPDLIAHREGTGWKAHLVWSTAEATPRNMAMGAYVNITSGGVITVSGTNDYYLSPASPGYSLNTHTFPSIDFNHTGDGKTVAGGTPHLYVAWSAGTTGAGKGIRFRKAVYSAGPTWTWNTEREIDNTQYSPSTGYGMSTMFDGTRVVVVGQFYDGANIDVKIYERDAADTTTVINTVINNTSNTGNGGALFSCSATYDAQGNVYLFGQDSAVGGTIGNLTHYKWTRTTGTLSSKIVLDQSDSVDLGGYPSVKRGYSNNRIEWVYTYGNNSPYAVKYDRIIASIGDYVPKVML